MASWDVVGGAGVEDPGGHRESVYTVDPKPAIETARLRPERKLIASVRTIYHVSNLSRFELSRCLRKEIVLTQETSIQHA